MKETLAAALICLAASTASFLVLAQAPSGAEGAIAGSDRAVARK